MRVLVERIESRDVGRSGTREDMGKRGRRHDCRGAMSIAPRVAVSLDHTEYPRVMLDGAVNGGGRGGIHAFHPIFVKLVRIPHLVVVGMGGAVLVMVGVHVLRTQEFVVLLLFHILPYDDFELCAKDDAKAVAANGLLYASDAAAFTPFVQFTTEGVCLEFEETEFAGC